MSMLRTIAYNVLQCTGFPPEAREPSACAPERYAAALAAYAPDLVTLCEAPDAGTVDALAGALRMTAIRFESPLRWPGALLTRLEIVEAANCPLPGPRPEALFTRHWGRAVLRRPDRSELVVHSAHLHPGDAEVREREVLAILEAMRDDLLAGRDVVLQGDLNHRPDMPLTTRMYLGSDLTRRDAAFGIC
jgi:endonuclease/exonuclease/phosphatase family metal-dependent hydrolase